VAGKIVYQRGMEETPENGKESSHSAHANGLNESSYNALLTSELQTFWCRQDSVVGIATCCGLNGLGIESKWGHDFLHMSAPALCPTQPVYSRPPPSPYTVGTGPFSQEENCQYMALTSLPYLVLRLGKSRAIHTHTHSLCSRVSFTFVNLSVNQDFWIIWLWIKLFLLDSFNMVEKSAGNLGYFSI
jgi:hypothetical protein